MGNNKVSWVRFETLKSYQLTLFAASDCVGVSALDRSEIRDYLVLLFTVPPLFSHPSHLFPSLCQSIGIFCLPHPALFFSPVSSS